MSGESAFDGNAAPIDAALPPPAGRASLLARYLQEQFRACCPDGWHCTTERPLLGATDRALLGYDPRADVSLERTDGTRRLWIEFEISRADPAANHAKFATAHVLRPWGPADAFVSMISAHVARGRRNLGAGMIHLMRQVGIDAFQTILLPDLGKDRIKSLNHDARALFEAHLDVAPEIERILEVAQAVATTTAGRLHFAADVFDVLLNLRRWNEEADDARTVTLWRRRAVRYLVLDRTTGWCAPAKFAAYVVLPSRSPTLPYRLPSGGPPHASADLSTDPPSHSPTGDPVTPSPFGLDSRMTFERYLHLDHAEPLFDGHRAWTHLTRQLAFVSRSYQDVPAEAALFDAWYARRAHLLQVDRQHLRLLFPPPAFQ